MRNVIILFIMIMNLNSIVAQVSHGGIPLYYDSTLSRTNMSSTVLKSIDNNELRQKSVVFADEYGYSKKKLYGISVPVSIDIRKEANCIVKDSMNIFYYKVKSPTAYAMQLVFNKFYIPTGSKMFIYNGDKTEYIGSFTELNNNSDSLFSTIFLNGNELIIEYHEPQNVEFTGRLFLDKIVHCFIDMKHGIYSPDGSSTCEKDIMCNEGNPWRISKSAVAQILSQISSSGYQYWGWCTGTLLNNTLQDGRPYFLTAMHCSLGMDNDGFEENYFTENMIFVFNYEVEQCGVDGANLPLSKFKSVAGATILSRDTPVYIKQEKEYNTYGNTSDYMLLYLMVSPDTLKNWGVSYAGWDANEDKMYSGNIATIHHPNGDVKKISLSNKVLETDQLHSYLFKPYWKIRWDVGVTEGGSSGAPLFNSENKVIGQLWGGSPYCGTKNGKYEYYEGPDFYGRFSVSYEKGLFKQYLDPLSSGVKSIGYYLPSDRFEHCFNGKQDYDETGIDCGGKDCIYCGYRPTHCDNKKKDGDETGIDCGGSCNPCGGVYCNNCIKDGDEEGLDCGGSCMPCNTLCNNRAEVYYSNTSNLPPLTKVEYKIETSGNVIIEENKTNVFESGNLIVLKPGFKAMKGCVFSAKIQPCVCKPICSYFPSGALSPNGDGINDILVYYVSGVNRYNAYVFNRSGKKIYQTSGNVVDNKINIWDGGNYSTGTYYVTVEVYNDCLGTSEKYQKTITLWRTSRSLTTNIENTTILTDKAFIEQNAPNPVVDQTEILFNIPETAQKAYIEFYNIDGTIEKRYSITERNVGSLILNATDFMKGYYIYSLVVDGKVVGIKKMNVQM
ncbi:MAG: hypothetical protein BHV71_09090 [Bacteroides sp. 41_26]|nr:MAG: hypothetical protein BHV71_09090 [Bacteroides sp. 41_26]